MIERDFIDDALLQFAKYRTLAERAIAQVSDDAFAHVDDPEQNSIALIVKHVAGNQHSRWTDFLTSDGEKPDRMRDDEFVRKPGDTRDALMARWASGWRLCLDAVGALAPGDLARTVTIRGEPHTVMQAINRQLLHYAYHVGQIVLLARAHAGDRWVSLSIPRGASADFEVARDGDVYEPNGDDA